MLAQKSLRPFLLCVFSISLLFGKVPLAVASDVLTLHLNLLPHRLTMQSGTQYDLFLEKLLDDSNLRVGLNPAPLDRARQSFLNDEGSCLFPTNARALLAGSGNPDVDLIVSEVVDVASMRLYTTEKTLAAVKISDFIPERLAYIRGSGAVHILGGIIEKVMAISSEEQLIRMLELGRIDAFLGHHPDTALALDDLGRPQALHASPVAIKNLSFPISFVCHNTEKNRTFLKTVNAHIKRMHANGQIRQILGPYAEFGQPVTSDADGPFTD